MPHYTDTQEHSFSKTIHWKQFSHTGKLTGKCLRNCFPIKYDPQCLSLHLWTVYHL